MPFIFQYMYGSIPYNFGVRSGARAESSSIDLWLESSTLNEKDKNPLACFARDLCSFEPSVTRVVTSHSVEVYAEQLGFPEPSSRKLWV